MKLLTFATIVALCGAEKLDRTYLPPPGAKLSGGSPGAIKTPAEKHGPTGSDPDYQAFLTLPVESESSVPFSQGPSQSSPDLTDAQRPGVPFSQESGPSSTGSRPFSNDMPSIPTHFQDSHDIARPGASIPQESRPALSDASSAIPGSGDRLPNYNVDSRKPESRPSFRDSVSSSPNYQGLDQRTQESPFLQGSRPSISDLVSTVPVSEGTIQRFPDENPPTRPQTSMPQGSRPSFSDSTSSVPIHQGSDQRISDSDDESRPGSSISHSVTSITTSQGPNQRFPGSNDLRPSVSVTQGSRPSYTDSHTINSQPSNGHDSLQTLAEHRYDAPEETGSPQSPIDHQKSSQYPAIPGTDNGIKKTSKPDHGSDMRKDSVSNEYIPSITPSPSKEYSRPSYESPVSQKIANYRNDNQRGPVTDITLSQYQNNRGAALFPTETGSQTPISNTRYQKPSSELVSGEINSPFRGSSTELTIKDQDSSPQFNKGNPPNKGNETSFESDATPSLDDADVDYDENVTNTGINSNGLPALPSAEDSARPRNHNDRYVQNVNRPQASLDRTAGIIRYESVINPDGTFAYNFETENGIKAREHGTSANGVQAEGDFSYVGDDGHVYSVTYTADERGYLPQGDHLPTSPPIPDAILKSLEIIAQHEAAGELDDGSYDESKYGPGQSGDSNDNDGRSRFIQENRRNDDFKQRTETELENENDLDSVEIKAAEPGSNTNDYDDNMYGNEQNVNQSQRPNYGSRTDTNKPANEEGNKYFRTGNPPSTNIDRHGVTSEPSRFEIPSSSISRLPSSDRSSVPDMTNIRLQSSQEYTTLVPESMVPGNRNDQVGPLKPGFEYTTARPDYSTPAVRGPQQTLPKSSLEYTPAAPGSVIIGNREHINRRPQVAYSPADLGNADETYSQTMPPKSPTQYLPAKQGSSTPRTSYQDIKSKTTTGYTSFAPDRFSSDGTPKPQPQYSVDYTSQQVNPSLSADRDYQTNSPTSFLQYTTQAPDAGERENQKTLPKSSLMYIPSAPGSVVPGKQDYEPRQPSEHIPIAPRPIEGSFQSNEHRPIEGSVQSDVTRYHQTQPKVPFSAMTTYQNSLPKSSPEYTASVEGMRKETANVESGNTYDEEISKSDINKMVTHIYTDRTIPERIQESNYSNNNGPSRFGRPEYESTTTERQPLLEHTNDQGGTRYSEGNNRHEISNSNNQSPATQTIRLTTIRPSQHRTTDDSTINSFDETTKSPYVPNNVENGLFTKGPFTVVTKIMPRINQGYKAEGEYNVQPNTEGEYGRRIESEYGRRTESRPQTNIQSKNTMQTSSSYVANEDGYNYQVPETRLDYNKFSPSSKQFNLPEQKYSQTDNPSEEDYGTTGQNKNVYTTNISPGSTQRNKNPSVTTLRPQSSSTFRSNVNEYNQAPNREEPNNYGIRGNDNLDPNRVRDNLRMQPFRQQPSGEDNPRDRNLEVRPQNTRPTPQQYNRFPPHSDSQDPEVADDIKNPELQGELNSDDQLDRTSQKPFGGPQSNTNNVYPQNGGDNIRLRPTPFFKGLPTPNAFVGTGEKFPGSRRPPSFSPETGYKY